MYNVGLYKADLETKYLRTILEELKTGGKQGIHRRTESPIWAHFPSGKSDWWDFLEIV